MRDDERLFLVGRTWHTWVYVAGKRVKRTTRCRTKAAARAVARQLEEAATDPARAAAEAKTLEDALNAVLLKRREQAKSGARAEDTADFYKKKSGHLLRLLGRETPLAHFSGSGPLDGYVSTRQSEIDTPTADHTIYKELTVMRAALKLAKLKGWWRGDVGAVVPQLSPRYKPRKTWATPEALAAIMRELTQDHAARAAFIIATSAELGATDRAQRVDIGPSFVHVRGTKRETRLRDVPIVTEWQRDALAAVRAKAQGKGGKLFLRSPEEFRWALRSACRRAGQAHLTPNDLRRTFSTWLRAQGARLENIAPAMGHADTRMLERVYDGTTPSQLGALLAADLDTVWTDETKRAATNETSETAPQSEKVPRGGIEPPTRGFSVRKEIWEFHRETEALSASAKSSLDTVWTARSSVRPVR